MDGVERAFVHIDFETAHYPEHAEATRADRERRRAAARATVPPRASHTWTYPAPVPANTVCPSSLTRTHVNGDAGSLGAASSARGDGV